MAQRRAACARPVRCRATGCRRGHVDVRQPAARRVEGALRVRAGRCLARSSSPVRRAAGGTRQFRDRVVRLAGRPDPHQSARRRGCVAEGVDRLARLRQVGLLRENTRRRVEVSRPVRRCARLVRERHGPRPRGGAGWRKRCGRREGAANGDDRDRARVARAHRPAVGRPRALQRRRILAVPLQAVHRPPPGVRARGADGVFRGRPRQLHVSRGTTST